MLTIPITAFVTLVIILVIANLSSGEKKIEHKIERLYASDDPQFLRSMGLLLGPPVIVRKPLRDVAERRTYFSVDARRHPFRA